MNDPLATRPSGSPPVREPSRTADYLPETSDGGADSSAPDPERTTFRSNPASSLATTDVAVPGFELIEELGRGGMGVVYRARQAKLNRVVALKMILAGDRAGERELIRFLAEAEAIASVRHPHVVQVYEYGESGGRPFMALEYCGGGTLAGRLKSGGIPPREAAALAARIARGVAAAHDLGIVHRDLKPANVFFDESGSPKVADFGLAKRTAGADLTQTNAVMGTPAYMSPEQAKGETKFVGPQADVWALGVILYECLTGVRPFAGDDTWTIIRAVIESEPRVPRKVVPALPRDLELICLKCLAKDSRERYPAAGDLAADLERWCAGEPVGVRPSGWFERAAKWAKRKPTVAAAYALSVVSILLIGFTSVAVWLWRDAESARKTAQGALGEAEAARASERDAKAQVAFLNYVHAVDLALREYEANNLLRARDLLDACPEDLRGWEWRHVHRLCHADLVTIPAPSDSTDDSAAAWDGNRIVTASGGVAKIWNPDGTLIHELKSPTTVDRVAFSGDRMHVATASDDNVVRIWNAATGQCRAELAGHTDSIHSVAFSRDGAALVTASADGTARVWNPDGKLLATMDVRPTSIQLARFSADGKRVVTVAGNETVGVWSADGKMIAVLRPGDSTYDAAFSPDGSRVATTHHKKTAAIWNADTGAKVADLTGHTGRVNAVAFSPDGRSLATTSYDNTARLWGAADGRLLATLEGHTDCVDGVAFAPDGLRLATCSWDKTLRLWDASGRPAGIIRGHTDRVWSVRFSPAGDRLLSSSEDGTARVWTVERDDPVFMKGHEAFIEQAAWNCDGSRIATASKDGTARIWAMRSSRTTARLIGHAGPVDAVYWSKDDSRILTVSNDLTARVWDPLTGRPISTLKGHDQTINDAHISDDGRLVATASEDGTAGIWDAAGGLRLHRLPHPVPVNFVLFLASNRLIGTASDDRSIRFFDSESGQARGALDGPEKTRALFFEPSPDGRRIAAACSDNHIRIWDLESREPVAEFLAHEQEVNSIRFSADGSRLVTAADEGKAAIWDASTGRKTADLTGHRDDVLGARFSPDGTRVLTYSRDYTARVWHAGNGQLMLTLPGHEGQMLETRFNPDGDRIDTASYIKMEDGSTSGLRVISYHAKPVNAAFRK